MLGSDGKRCAYQKKMEVWGSKTSALLIQSLLGKWRWKLFQNQGELWARVIESKYGGWRNLSEARSANNESTWWRDLKIVDQHPQQGQLLNNSIAWKVGRGDKFKFWEDTWIGEDNHLLEKYPRLHSISLQQDHFIQQMGDFKDSG